MWDTIGTRLERAQRAIRREGLAALIAITPENAAWLSGRTSTIAGFWRLPGLIVVGLNADGGMSVSSGDSETRAYPESQFIRFTHPFWLEHLDLRAIPAGPIAERIVRARPGGPVERPEQFDFPAMTASAASAIRAVAPNSGRIGLDLANAPGWLVHDLVEELQGLELADVSTLFDDLRAIKDADEIEHLRRAGELTDIGIAAAFAATRPGLSPVAVTAAYQAAVWQAAANDDRYLALREAEGLVGVGDGTTSGTRVGPGETIKLDMQVNVGGYHSDIGRTWAIAPTAEQTIIHDALLAALNEAVAAAQPGATFRDVWAAGTNGMRL
ncbi:MAG: M24 family metallopeptidase, partial [Thermomicrobiales bacterium]